MRSFFSNRVTSWPARASCWAAARPAGPEPTTATFLPVRTSAITGAIQPSSKARSTIVTSTCLIVTGSWLIPSTQAASHGAGHSRPVNSGKLLVACRRSIASRQWSRYTRSFQSGMRFPSGQPLLQNGMPQSMQRPACVCNFSRANGSYTSRQSCSRTGTGRRVGVSRLHLRNPVVSPTCRLHDRVVALVVGPAALLGFADDREHARVVLRHHLAERLDLGLPLVDQPLGDRRAGGLAVTLDGLAQPLPVGVVEWLEVDELVIDERCEHRRR